MIGCVVGGSSPSTPTILPIMSVGLDGNPDEIEVLGSSPR